MVNTYENENFGYEQKEYIAALEIGTSKLSIAIGEIENGNFKALLGLVDTSTNGVMEGRVVNIEDTARALSELIEDTKSIYGFAITEIIVGMTDPDVNMHKNSAMYAIEEDTVTIHDLKGVMRAAKAIPLPESEYMLHVLPVKYYVDGADTAKPLGMTGVRLDVDANILTVPTSSVMKIEKMCEIAGVEIKNLIYSPLAANYAVTDERQRFIGNIMIDIGAGTTDVTFFEDSTMKYTTVIPIGGDFLTGDISAIFHCMLEDADKLKRDFGCASPDYLENPELILDNEVKTIFEGVPVTLGQLSEVIESRVDEILNFVMHSFYEAELEIQPQHTVILTGGSSVLPGLKEHISNKWNIDVKEGIPNLPAGMFDYAKTPAYSVVVGLVMYGGTIENNISHKPVKYSEESEKTGIWQGVKSFFSAFFD